MIRDTGCTIRGYLEIMSKNLAVSIFRAALHQQAPQQMQ